MGERKVMLGKIEGTGEAWEVPAAHGFDVRGDILVDAAHVDAIQELHFSSAEVLYSGPLRLAGDLDRLLTDYPVRIVAVVRDVQGKAPMRVTLEGLQPPDQYARLAP
jgi:hypothetical protein